MSTFGKITKVIISSTMLWSLSNTSTNSQEQSSTENKIISYQEQFNGDDTSLMLGGQINFRNSKSNWLVYAADNKLVMENRLEPQSLHYDDIQWVRYPDSTVLSSTQGATISVTVEAKNNGRGAAGILVGSGDRGAYWVFGVDANGRYHVITKGGRKTTPAHSAKHPMVLIGEPNRVSFKQRGDNLAFLVNGTEVIQVPNGNQKINSRRINGTAGVGLAAFGLGAYSFDDVEITKNN